MISDLILKRGLIKVFLSALVCVIATAHHALATGLDAKALSEVLKDGGYVIYWRHGATVKGQRDNPNVDLNDCSTQRNLSLEGEQQASLIGKEFLRLGIQVDKVLTSPYCRCYDTGYLAFNRAQRDYNLYFSIDMSSAIRDDHNSKLIEYLSMPPEPGKNTVIVGHTSNLKEVSDIWPSPEGVMHIFKPETHGFKHMGLILPSYWTKP